MTGSKATETNPVKKKKKKVGKEKERIQYSFCYLFAIPILCHSSLGNQRMIKPANLCT